jgi:hypothetical protein
MSGGILMQASSIVGEVMNDTCCAHMVSLTLMCQIVIYAKPLQSYIPSPCSLASVVSTSKACTILGQVVKDGAKDNIPVKHQGLHKRISWCALIIFGHKVCETFQDLLDRGIPTDSGVQQLVIVRRCGS